MNEDELEQLREKLHKKYFDESVKIHQGIPDIDDTEVLNARENLDDI